MKKAIENAIREAYNHGDHTKAIYGLLLLWGYDPMIIYDVCVVDAHIEGPVLSMWGYDDHGSIRIEIDTENDMYRWQLEGCWWADWYCC